MFGFLKQKIADFGNKLKETIKKEEEKTVQEKESLETKKTSEEEKHGQKKEEIKHEEKQKDEKTKPQHEEKKEAEPEEQKEKTIPQEENKTKKMEKEEKKEPSTAQEKKQGILGKLFGFGKKEAQKTKENLEPLGEKKKTREEIASQMEKKMFEEINKEIAEEEQKKEKTQNFEEEKKKTEKPVKEQKEEIKIEKKPTPSETKKEELVEAKKILEEKKESLDEIEEELKEEAEEIIEQEERKSQKEEKSESREKSIKEKEIAEAKEKPRGIEIKTLEEEKRELKANVGVVGGIKGFLFGGVEITEKQIEDLLWELELSLVESDVEQDAANELVKQIKNKLIGMKTTTKNIDEYLKEQIKEILAEMMKTEKINLLEETKKKQKEEKPLKILLLGPNGAGKTTSIAKLVHYFKKHGLTSIIAAGDTFRAGAINQIEEHANKLSTRVIKQKYGADPAAVAFDAIRAAEAGKINIVIIDSAGRQETNKNLMEELRKIERIAKPDYKIFVGEAYVGQGLLDQVKEFEEIIGIDGFILTKIDTDAKGGTAISLLYKTKKPIIFIGTGQGYDDFEEFKPEFIINRIL